MRGKQVVSEADLGPELSRTRVLGPLSEIPRVGITPSQEVCYVPSQAAQHAHGPRQRG